MDALSTALLIALVGLCFGSFLTLVSYRLPRGEKLVMTRSACPACHTPLTPRDLVPVLSWAAARGRCRHCGVTVSWRYPAIELTTAAALLAVYATYGIGGQGLILMALTLCLLLMIVIDFEHMIIPDEVQILMAGLAVLYHALYGLHLAELLAGGGAGGAIGWALHSGYRRLRKREGLGMGDVKFLCVAGLWLGVMPLIPLLFYSGVLGVLTAGLWRLLRRGPLFPFGPALAVSLWSLLLWPQTNEWFWRWPDIWMTP